MFVLRNPANGREGLVSCDVRRESTGIIGFTNNFHSLAISLEDPDAKNPTTVIVIGTQADVIYKGLIKF